MKKLILLVGKSGSGKNYIIDAFDLKPIVSYTTRSKRINETNGIEHWFVSLKDWEELDKSKIAAWTYFNNNFYWTLYDDINDIKNEVYIVDPKGIEDVLNAKIQGKITRDLKIIYLNANEKTRIKRMKKRKDNKQQIKERIKNDNKMFKVVKFDIMINVND